MVKIGWFKCALCSALRDVLSKWVRMSVDTHEEAQRRERDVVEFNALAEELNKRNNHKDFI